MRSGEICTSITEPGHATMYMPSGGSLSGDTYPPDRFSRRAAPSTPAHSG